MWLIWSRGTPISLDLPRLFAGACDGRLCCFRAGRGQGLRRLRPNRVVGQQNHSGRPDKDRVVHQNHARTEKAVVPSAWSANFRRGLLIDPGKIELIS